MGAERGLCERGQYVHACVWDSSCVAFTSEVFGLRAASLTSSRRVGILIVLEGDN